MVPARVPRCLTDAGDQTDARNGENQTASSAQGGRAESLWAS